MSAPSIIQTKVARLTSAATSLACTFDTTPGVGRLIVVFGFASGGYPTIADNQGNTYTQRESEGYATIWGRIWTAPAATASGSFTVTLTPSSGSQVLTLVCFEIANWNSGTAIEKNGHKWDSISSGNSPYSPLNFTATTAAEQLFLAMLTAEHSGSPTRNYGAGSGWTLEQQVTTSGGGQVFGAISKSVTSTGTYDPELTVDGGATNTVMLGLSLVGGTDGGGGGSPEWSAAPTISVAQGGTDTFNLPVTVSGGGTITLAWVAPGAKPAWLTLNSGATPSVTFSGAQLDADDVAGMVISATANSQTVNSSAGSITVNPLASPVWSAVPAYTVTEGQTGSFSVPVSVSGGGTITLAWVSPGAKPSWLTLNSGASPTVSFSGAQLDANDVASMVLSATANGNTVNSSPGSITVNAVPPSPVWGSAPTYTATEGESGTFAVPVSLVGGGAITLAWVGPGAKPAWITLNSGASPTISFSGAQVDANDLTGVVISATANGNTVNSAAGSITVNPAAPTGNVASIATYEIRRISTGVVIGSGTVSVHSSSS